jgi:Protein of unknown function (DUF4242)
MPEYIDVHRNVKGITAEQLMEAHQKDLDLQDQENANFKHAWGDPETGTVFCLSEAPSKEPSCVRMSVPAIRQTRSTRSRPRRSSGSYP